jgi:hypothetical protein
MPIWMLIDSVDSIPEVLVLGVIPLGVLAAARAYWKSSTRSIRERMAGLVDAIRESLHTRDEEREPKAEM